MNPPAYNSSALAPLHSGFGTLLIEGEAEEACTVCRGRGCGACAWLGTAEAEMLYWETKRLLVRFINLA